MLALSGETEGGPDIFGFQIREIAENLLFCHSGREIVQHIPYRKAQVASAWLAEHALGIHGYARMVWYLHVRFVLSPIVTLFSMLS
jgi:hypothetical protein